MQPVRNGANIGEVLRSRLLHFNPVSS